MTSAGSGSTWFQIQMHLGKLGSSRPFSLDVKRVEINRGEVRKQG